MYGCVNIRMLDPVTEITAEVHVPYIVTPNKKVLEGQCERAVAECIVRLAAGLREIDYNDPATWPTELPNRSGFYWCLLSGTTRPVIVRLLDGAEAAQAQAISTMMLGVVRVEPYELELAGARWRPGEVHPW